MDKFDKFMKERPYMEYDEGDLEFYEDFGEDAEMVDYQ